MTVQTTMRASFTAMVDGTQADWDIVRAAEDPVLAESVLDHLRLLAATPGGFAVDRLTHSLQTATRAERAGRSDTYVLAALLHDIGDTLSPFDHSALGALICKPFIGEDLHWMMARHGDFQLYYFGHFVGADRNIRDRYAGHEYYDLTAEFCEAFDQNSFDPDYDTEPLDHFEPLVRQLIVD